MTLTLESLSFALAAAMGAALEDGDGGDDEDGEDPVGCAALGDTSDVTFCASCEMRFCIS